MGIEWERIAHQKVQKAIQSARCSHRGILLFEATRSGISGVGKGLFALGRTLGIEPLERGKGHKHLATNLKEVGIALAPQTQGHRANGTDIGSHIITTHAVATRHSAQQSATLIDKRDGRSVEFEFGDVVHLTRLLLHTVEKLVQIVARVGIRQRQHRVDMLHTLELARKVATHASCGRVGVVEFGVRLLQILQLAHQSVVLKVVNLGSVFDIIFMIVVFERTSQLGNPLVHSLMNFA